MNLLNLVASRLRRCPQMQRCRALRHVREPRGGPGTGTGSSAGSGSDGSPCGLIGPNGRCTKKCKFMIRSSFMAAKDNGTFSLVDSL